MNTLTEEVVTVSSWRSVFMTVAGVLILAFIINMFVMLYLESNPYFRVYWLINKKWSLLNSLDDPVDWLVLGDSSCNQGIKTDVLTEKIGGKGVNLCTIRQMNATDDAWMLGRYIEKFGAPKNVLIIHTHDSWLNRKDLTAIAKIPLPWGYWNKYFPRIPMSFRDNLRIFVIKYIPLYSSNRSVKGLMSSPLRYFRDEFNLEPDGYMPGHEARPESVERSAEEFARSQSNDKFRISGINQRAMHHIIELADQYTINVFLANAPVYEGLYKDERLQNYFAQLDSELYEISAKSRNIHFLDSVSLFSSSQMENLNHIIDPAAEEYSRAIAQQILEIQRQ